MALPLLRLRVKPTAASTGGSLSLDGNVYSLFRNTRLSQASSLIVEQNECSRLWHALFFDLQVGTADRVSKEIASR
jgi:hypothetical protein